MEPISLSLIGMFVSDLLGMELISWLFIGVFVGYLLGYEARSRKVRQTMKEFGIKSHVTL